MYSLLANGRAGRAPATGRGPVAYALLKARERKNEKPAPPGRRRGVENGRKHLFPSAAHKAEDDADDGESGGPMKRRTSSASETYHLSAVAGLPLRLPGTEAALVLAAVVRAPDAAASFCLTSLPLRHMMGMSMLRGLRKASARSLMPAVPLTKPCSSSPSPSLLLPPALGVLMMPGLPAIALSFSSARQIHCRAGSRLSHIAVGRPILTVGWPYDSIELPYI